jgi:hypothetical protein
MNAGELWPPGGFQDRLEAELVRVVSARAVRPPRRGRRAAAAMRRPAVRAGVLTVAFALAVTAWVAVGGPLLSQRQAAPVQARGGGAGPVHVSTAAFTVDRGAAGTIRVTWDKARYIQGNPDIASLQRALRAAGLTVLIKEGVFCAGPHDSGQLGAGGVGPGVGAVMTGEDRPGGDVVFIFTPSAMPAGDELFIGYLSPSQLAVTHGRPGSVERLVPTGVPLTCTSQLPGDIR